MQEMRNLNCSSVEAGGILVFSLAILKTCFDSEKIKSGGLG